MVIRATFTLDDGTTHVREFESQDLADSWLLEVTQSGVYGEAGSYQFASVDVTAEVKRTAEKDAAGLA